MAASWEEHHDDASSATYWHVQLDGAPGGGIITLWSRAIGASNSLVFDLVAPKGNAKIIVYGL